MIAAYHRLHGDDYGSERSRAAKYQAILEMCDPDYLQDADILDVGCGSKRFKDWLPASCEYTGIDLLTGTNALDYTTRHDLVVANGVLYKLADVEEAWDLIHHLWSLAKDALIFTSLSSWAARPPGELTLDPSAALDECRKLTRKVALRHDYLPHDFCVALYR